VLLLYLTTAVGDKKAAPGAGADFNPAFVSAGARDSDGQNLVPLKLCPFFQLWCMLDLLFASLFDSSSLPPSSEVALVEASQWVTLALLLLVDSDGTITACVLKCILCIQCCYDKFVDNSFNVDS